MAYTNQTFEQFVSLIVHRGINNIDNVMLRQVANELWTTSIVPDLGRVPAELRADAGYLIDRLTRYNAIDQSREVEILTALAPWQDQIEHDASPLCRDPLAQEWGASGDLPKSRLVAIRT